MATRELVTVNNWQAYKHEFHDNSFMEYLYANESVVEKLNKILSSPSSKELREQLQSFYDERKSFVKHARLNAD